MIYQQAEGIILRVIPLGEYDQLLVVFTREVGLIKLIYKGSRSKKRGIQGICVPLTEVEVIYREKNSEIFSGHEIALLNAYTFLKQELSYLETACDLLKVIAASQLPGKPAPILYTLLCFYLGKISQSPDLSVLMVSFRLKLLKHEGLITFPCSCCECGHSLDATAAYSRRDGWWCKEHQAIGSLYWSASEMKSLFHLGFCQSFRELNSYSISPEIKEKTHLLFASMF